MTHRILVIHGPNLNLLGSREPEHYGTMTIDEVNAAMADKAADLGLELVIEQRNSEGEIIDLIHRHCTGDPSSPGKAAGLLINPAAYSHYSYAIRDAISAVSVPVVEVHLTNPSSRKEDFRHRYVTGAVCDGIISGFGADSYLHGLGALKNLIS